MRPWGFLIASCLVSGLFAMVFFAGMDIVFATAYSVNGLLVPVMLAAILFCVGKLLCTQAPVFRTLFTISAYANVTLLIAWVPGVSWMAGLWRFYLIGVGLVRLGGIGRSKAVQCVVLTAVILLSVILATLRFNT